MGRWAQRTRSGGGTPSNPTLANMIEAQQESSIELSVEWNSPAPIGNFDLADFITVTGAFVPTSMSQVNPTTILFEFADDLSGETELQYTGDTPGFLTPDSVPITPI